MAVKPIVLSLVILCLLCVKAQARPFLIIFDSKPFFREKHNGEYAGIDIDIIEKVMQQLEVSYELRMLNASSRLLKMAKQGEADMVLSLSFDKTRADYLIYPAESYKTLRWHFFIRQQDRDKIRYQSFADLKGWIVGATKGYSYSPEFWQAGLNLQLTTDDSVHMRMLLAGRVDVVPMGAMTALAEARKQGYFEQLHQLKKPISEKIYFNVLTRQSSHRKKSQVVQSYDAIIRSLKSQGTIDQIYLKHLGHIPQ